MQYIVLFFYSLLCLALQKNQEMNIENTQAQMRKGILEYWHFTDHRATGRLRAGHHQ